MHEKLKYLIENLKSYLISASIQLAFKKDIFIKGTSIS